MGLRDVVILNVFVVVVVQIGSVDLSSSLVIKGCRKKKKKKIVAMPLRVKFAIEEKRSSYALMFP